MRQIHSCYWRLCETCYAWAVRTITIRDLRQRWPEAEAALQAEDEIIVTRDSKPVAKLVRVTQAEAKRTRWTAEEHRRWIKKVFGRKVFPSSDEPLAAARADRKLT
jgi:antitoxin (DNA-binding transcriptional repressor) of toxin-antitoxin stability system